MTQTIRRELRQKFVEVFIKLGIEVDSIDECVDALADAALEVRGIAMADKPTARIDRTDAEQDQLDEKKMQAIVGAAQEGGKTIDACVMFEKAFGVGKWPWDTSSVWQEFAKFVRAIHEADPLAFGNYVVWRADPNGGKYSGYSNKKIRENPKAFMDTGWPEFVACQTTEINSTQTPPKDGSGFYA